MHSAPSVNYPVGRSRYAERLLWVLWGLGATCAAFACVRFDGFDWRPMLLAASVLITGITVWAGAASMTMPADLGFDGQQWSFSGGAGLRAARARVALDLQRLMLVDMVEPGRARHWVWVDQCAMPERWRDLRRALYARPAPTVSSASPQSAGQAPGA